MKSHNPPPDLVRVKNLKMDDKILINGIVYKVTEVTEDKIIYGYQNNTGNWTKNHWFGRNSEQWVERVK